MSLYHWKVTFTIVADVFTEGDKSPRDVLDKAWAEVSSDPMPPVEECLKIAVAVEPQP